MGSRKSFLCKDFEIRQNYWTIPLFININVQLLILPQLIAKVLVSSHTEVPLPDPDPDPDPNPELVIVLHSIRFVSDPVQVKETSHIGPSPLP